MPVNSSARGRLDSWKEIADYLKRDTRTAIRWEQERGMPVHRVPGGKRQTVFAFTDEIDAWLLSQEPKDRTRDDRDPGAQKPSIIRRVRAKLGLVLLIGAGFLAGVGIIIFLLARSRRSAPVHPLSLNQLTDDGYQKEGLATDGTTLYFGERVGSRLVIASAPVNGGPVHRIQTPFTNLTLEDLSNDGNRLLIRSLEGIAHDAPLWVIPATGGTPHRVGEMTCAVARWSPDNQKIACARGRTILVTDEYGSHERALGTFSLPVVGLIWTRDGRQLRFVLSDVEAQKSSQWEISVNGNAAQPQRLPLSPTCCSGWTWTSDGIAFLYGDFDAQGKDRLMLRAENGLLGGGRVDSELPVRIGALRGLAAGKGHNLLYLAIDRGFRGELLKFDLKHDEPVAFLPGLSASYVAFSGDHQWISYVATGDQSLWRSQVDGTGALQLTKPPMFVEVPAWSPDGRSIAFTGREPGKPARIYVVDRDGGAAKEVAEGKDNQGGPSWSPDGKMIVYGNTFGEETQDGWVRRINLATREVRIVPGSHNFRTARWSPDGKYIAALDWKARRLMLFDVRNERWGALADSVEGDNISWSSNSESIFVEGVKEGRPVVEQIRVRGARKVTAASLNALQKVPGEFNWFGLTPDDLLIVFHMRTSGEIYSLEWTDR